VLGLAGLHQVEIDYLPGKRMLKCLSSTANLGQVLRKAQKRVEKNEIKKER